MHAQRYPTILECAYFMHNPLGNTTPRPAECSAKKRGEMRPYASHRAAQVECE